MAGPVHRRTLRCSYLYLIFAEAIGNSSVEFSCSNNSYPTRPEDYESDRCCWCAWKCEPDSFVRDTLCGRSFDFPRRDWKSDRALHLCSAVHPAHFSPDYGRCKFLISVCGPSPMGALTGWIHI
ncbi:hypothetical protein KP509_03G053500 [Ceratopteris richardii]|uniref:Uncharacterized protein n=1 Tax=Ceratopteris richardii TaxID=49495 RepID=A0A8T2V796_CERRI|nr:hypothetical protein KP509_03G053500 [Ceratopteris richardii]